RHTRSDRDWSSDVCSSDLDWWHSNQSRRNELNCSPSNMPSKSNETKAWRVRLRWSRRMRSSRPFERKAHRRVLSVLRQSWTSPGSEERRVGKGEWSEERTC